MDTIRYTARLLSWTGLFVVPVVAGVWGLRAAAGVASGMLWGLANVWALSRLVAGALGPRRAPLGIQVALWVVKIPLLYAVGAFLLLSPWGSPIGFLVGFSCWFALLFVGALRGAPA